LSNRAENGWASPVFTHLHSSAVHEAGHAVLAVVLGRKLQRISINRDETSDGSTGRTVDYSSPLKAIEEIAIKLAGGESAGIWYLPTDCDDDCEQIKCILKLFLMNCDGALLIHAIQKHVRDEVLLQRAPIAELALALFEKRTMSGDEAASLVKTSLCQPSPLGPNLKRLQPPYTTLH
jgi:hypothetical protein